VASTVCLLLVLLRVGMSVVPGGGGGEQTGVGAPEDNADITAVVSESSANFIQVGAAEVTLLCCSQPDAHIHQARGRTLTVCDKVARRGRAQHVRLTADGCLCGCVLQGLVGARQKADTSSRASSGGAR